MNNLLGSLNDLVSELRSEYRCLCDSKSERILECFEAKFKTSIEAQLYDISLKGRELIEFLTVAQVLEELDQTTEVINKYHIVYLIQELFKHIDGSFLFAESEQYVEARKREKILKQTLCRYGIPSEWINSHFNTSQSRGEKLIAPPKAKESYSQYLNRLFGRLYGDFDEMMKVYKKITPSKDWKLYDNIKLLVAALRANGVTKTANQLYEHLNEN